MKEVGTGKVHVLSTRRQELRTSRNILEYVPFSVGVFDLELLYGIGV